MSVAADDQELLKKYPKIWEKISGLIGQKNDSEVVNGGKYIKKKIKSYKDNMKANFHSKKVP